MQIHPMDASKKFHFQQDKTDNPPNLHKMHPVDAPEVVKLKENH
jgi:hypothetical protein